MVFEIWKLPYNLDFFLKPIFIYIFILFAYLTNYIIIKMIIYSIFDNQI